MTMDREKRDGAAELRRRAEEAAREEHPPVQAEGVPNPDPGRTLQELRVHQIELEMQNAELLQIQEALEDEKARYYELYNLAPVGYCTLRDGLILEANATLAALLGVRREHLVWKALTMFIHGEAQDRYFLHTRRLFEAGGTQALDLRMVKMDRTPFWAHLVATVAPDSHAGHEPGSPSSPCCRLVLTDITERKQREEEAAKAAQLLQKSKELATLGVLAGGIAHDFNNLLTTMLGCANMGVLAVEKNSRACGLFWMIEQATQRAAELTDKLQAYAGQGKYHETELDLDLIVKEVVQQFSLDLPPNVTLLCELADRLPYVRGDADQVAQVLTNMILNATEAFPTEAGGLVVIRTGSEAVDVARLGEGQWPLEVAPGRCATLEVADTGAGMSSEVAARAFEPFFSTKFTGRGLGLAAVKGMLGRHQGGLCVRSEPGRGSSLKIFLPVMTAPRPARGPEPLEPWRGTGSLLLIDEDEAGLTVARSLAERLGLKVLEARDAEEACALFRQCHAEMLLVILGANVLRKNGQAALRTMRKLNERVPVVVSLDHDEPGEGMLPGSLAGTIKKPIRMAELQGLLKRAAPHAPGDGAITA